MEHNATDLEQLAPPPFKATDSLQKFLSITVTILYSLPFYPTGRGTVDPGNKPSLPIDNEPNSPLLLLTTYTLAQLQAARTA